MLYVHHCILYIFLSLRIVRDVRCDTDVLAAPFNGYKSFALENETAIKLVPKTDFHDSAEKKCNFTVIENDATEESKNFFFNSSHLLVQPGFLDYETKKVHFLEVLQQCTLPVTDNKSVHIELHVLDVNEFRPYFSQSSYKTKYVENDTVKYILKVLAYDMDGTNDHHVCGYRIKTPGVPFNITEDGFISPTHPLLRHNATHYVFNVSAIDCIDGSESDNAEVNVFIEEHCHPSWTERKDIKPTRDYPVKNIELLKCAYCEPVDIVARIALDSLNTSDIDCDLSQCQNEINTVELLKGGSFMTEPTSDSIYSFNGYDDFLKVDHADMDWTPSHPFSISFWMRRKKDDSHTKRQILCQSDAYGLNRHHFSIFLSEDAIKLLLRQNPLPPPANHEFFPSQWAWKLSAIKENEWHFYHFTVEFPNVRLLIDHGITELKQADVIEDYPLETVFDNHNDTVLSIGACWHGRSQKYSQFFRGDLALLQYTRNRTRSVRCLRNCTERLELTDENEEVAFNENRSVAVLRVPSLPRLHSLLQKVKYVNEKHDTSLRTIQITGTIVCKDMPKIQIAQFNKTVGSMKTFVEMSGPRVILEPSSALVTGIKPFNNVSIYGYAMNDGVITPETIVIQQCFVCMEPVSTIHEILSFPEDSLILIQHTTRGVLLSGAHSMEEYEKLLQQFVFASTSHAVLSWNFSIECTPNQDNKEYGKVKIVVKRETPDEQEPTIADGSIPEDLSRGRQEYKDVTQPRSRHLSGWAFGVIITTCSGLVVFGITYYIAKQTSRRGKQVPDEMEWDDTALNIRVNPLERVNDYSSSDDDDYDDDDDYSSYDECNRGNRELEWDDLNFNSSKI